MSRRACRRVFTAVLTIALVAVPLRADAWSTSGRIETIAMAQANEEPAQRVVDTDVDVRLVRGDELDAANGALAHSSCDNCETVAVALQVVVLSSNEDVDVTAENEALAINEECTDCRSLAAAHQVVVVTPGYARLTWKARAKVKQLRKQLRRMLRTPSPLDDLDTRIAALAEQLKTTVMDGLVVWQPVRPWWYGRPQVKAEREQTKSRGPGWWHGG